MSSYSIVLLIISSIIIYMMIEDRNVAEYFLLFLKLIKINFDRLKWLILLHPIWFDNPISKRNKAKEYESIAEQLMKEFNPPQEDT